MGVGARIDSKKKKKCMGSIEKKEKNKIEIKK